MITCIVTVVAAAVIIEVIAGLGFGAIFAPVSLGESGAVSVAAVSGFVAMLSICLGMEAVTHASQVAWCGLSAFYIGWK